MFESRRIEFSELTKKILAGSAGHMCSFTDCPQTTIGPEVKEDESAGTKRFAVAAHIYAASPQGPRPPGSMSEDEIRSEENGVWMCPSCAELVDKFQFQYPAAMLLEMKRIRVTAQRLAMHDKTIAFMAHWIGVMRLDRIVRDHLPDLDTARIRQAVEKAWIIQNTAYAERDPLPAPPFPLAILPALNQAMRHATAAGVEHRIEDGSGWKELIDNWRVRFGSFPDEPQRAARIDKGYAKIYARDPVSGELSHESIETETFAMLTDDNTDPLNRHQSIHLRHTFSNTSSLEWELNVKPTGVSFEVSSNLTMCMRVMRRHDPSAAARRGFESYASVLTKIASGWHPVGFVGVTFADRTLEREYHPTPVSIVSKIKPEQLQQGLRRNERVRVGYKLADQFEITPRFTEVWFSDLVTDQKLLEGATTFLTGLGPKPWPRSVSSALLQIDHRRQLVLSVSSYTLVAKVELGSPATHSTQV